MAAALLPFVYLFREWPPSEIRAALTRAPALSRGIVVVGVLIAYGVATAPLVRILVASRRLELLRTLPLSRGFWQQVHAGHLALLGVPIWGAIAYGVANAGAYGACCGAVLGVSVVWTSQILGLALSDRPRLRAGLLVLVAGLAVLTVAFAPGPGALLGAVGLVAAVVRLRGSFPAVRPPRRRGAARRSKRAVAIARALRRGWVRRAPAQATWTFAMMATVAGLTVFGVAQVHVVEPTAAASMIRGAAILGGMSGAASVLHAVRATDRDRWWWDYLPCADDDELSARVLVGATVIGPLSLALLATALWWGWIGLAVEVVVAVSWAVTFVVAFVARRERASELSRAAAPAILAVTAVAAVGAIGVRSTWVLAPWLVVAGLAARRDTTRARRARRRFETYREDDDHA